MDAYKVRISPEHVALIRAKGLGLNRGLFILLNELLQHRGEAMIKAERKSNYANLTPEEEAQRRANYQAGRDKAAITRRNRDIEYGVGQTQQTIQAANKIKAGHVYLGGQLVTQDADSMKEKT